MQKPPYLDPAYAPGTSGNIATDQLDEKIVLHVHTPIYTPLMLHLTYYTALLVSGSIKE